MNRTYRSPVFTPPTAWPVAPTARSVVPSPLRSPMLATEAPKRSPGAMSGPFWVEALTSAVRCTVPSGFMNRTYRSPVPVPPPKRPVAPTAMSGVPSPSRSPILATEAPKRSPDAMSGPFGVEALISTTFLIAALFSVNTMRTEPAPE